MTSVELAFIQKEDHGEFVFESGYSFWAGCRLLGVETVFFQRPEFDTLPLRKETLVMGGVGTVRKAFERLGVPQPAVGEMPPTEILEFYGRKLWATTMAEVRNAYETNEHFFIKPLRMHKEFVGHVTSGLVGDLVKTASLPDEFEILASEVIRFEVEYRLFVHRGKVIGAKHYRGNFRKSVDFSVADTVIERYPDAPVAYSLDLGLDEHGRTLVVEINDSFALGSYGLSSLPYTRMVIDRWEEIVGLNS